MPDNKCRHGMRTAMVLQGGGALGAYQAGVYRALPESERADERLQAYGGLGSEARMDVVRLGRHDHPWEMSSKDVNFSWSLIKERWHNGYCDAARITKKQPWTQRGANAEGIKVYLAEQY